VKNNDLSIIYERMAAKKQLMLIIITIMHKNFSLCYLQQQQSILTVNELCYKKTHQMVVSKVRQISTKEMFYDRISLSEVNPIIEEFIGLHQTTG